MLLDIPAVVNGLNRISSSSSSIEAAEVSFLARGTSNTSANKARQIMRVCRILRLMRLVYLYNQYELHKQVGALLSHVTQLASTTWHMQNQCASTCINESGMSVPFHAHKFCSNTRTLLLVLSLSIQINVVNQELQQSFSGCKTGPTLHDPNLSCLSLQLLLQLIFALLQRCMSPLKLCFYSAWFFSAYVSSTSALPELLLMWLGLARAVTSMSALLGSLVMQTGLG